MPPAGTRTRAKYRPFAWLPLDAKPNVGDPPSYGLSSRTKTPPAPKAFRPAASRQITRVVEPASAFRSTSATSVASTPSFAPDAGARRAATTSAAPAARSLTQAVSAVGGRTSPLDRQVGPRPLVPRAGVVARIEPEPAQNLRGEGGLRTAVAVDDDLRACG